MTWDWAWIAPSTVGYAAVVAAAGLGKAKGPGGGHIRILFWACLSITGYAYVGYALAIRLAAKLRPRPVRKSALLVPVTVVIAARNEAENLRRKLQNLREMDYPAESLEILIVSDGSTDGTHALLTAEAERVRSLLLPQSVGKAAALNAAVRQATGEVLVMMDARQMVDPDAVRELVACLADPKVGAVSGELLLEDTAGRASGEALGVYWRIEKFLRQQESRSGSVVGVTGAIYAVRRELFREIPPGTILDDLYVPMCVARQGRRVLFEPAAIARDRVFQEKGKEFGRKVRTLTGNYQLLRTLPWLLSPSNPLLFRFVSHKLLRLLVPLLLALMLLSSALAAPAMYRVFFTLQLAFYLLAALGQISPAAKRNRLVGIANTFAMLNIAATVALYNFLTGKTEVWMPAGRAQHQPAETI